MQITLHAKHRINERIDVRRYKKMFQMALKYGKNIGYLKQVKPTLYNSLIKRSRYQQVKVWQGNVFIYTGQRLITVYSLTQDSDEWNNSTT